MKTITRIPGNVSLYLIEDDQPVTIEADHVSIGEPVWLIVGDCNTDNCKLLPVNTAPADWTGGKYCFDGVAWSANPDYKEPQDILPPEPQP